MPELTPIEDQEREFHLDVVAIEVLRRAAEDFGTVSDGWCKFPELTEENWGRVTSRVHDIVHDAARCLDLPAPWADEDELPGFWNDLQWKARLQLGEETTDA